jgi:predicted DNA binding CopG/RHH family protein
MSPTLKRRRSMGRNIQPTNPEYLHDVEDWESGKLGADATHAKPTSTEDEREMDEAMGLQVVSVRLPKQLIAQLKLLAGDKGLGYQPYLRMVLMDHVKVAAPKKKTS